ncbi:MAG: hypothetical protein WCG27_04135 [Pseudomonadota bacterium]
MKITIISFILVFVISLAYAEKTGEQPNSCRQKIQVPQVKVEVVAQYKNEPANAFDSSAPALMPNGLVAMVDKVGNIQYFDQKGKPIGKKINTMVDTPVQLLPLKNNGLALSGIDGSLCVVSPDGTYKAVYLEKKGRDYSKDLNILEHDGKIWCYREGSKEIKVVDPQTMAVEKTIKAKHPMGKALLITAEGMIYLSTSKNVLYPLEGKNKQLSNLPIENLLSPIQVMEDGTQVIGVQDKKLLAMGPDGQFKTVGSIAKKSDINRVILKKNGEMATLTTAPANSTDFRVIKKNGDILTSTFRGELSRPRPVELPGGFLAVVLNSPGKMVFLGPEGGVAGVHELDSTVFNTPLVLEDGTMVIAKGRGQVDFIKVKQTGNLQEDTVTILPCDASQPTGPKNIGQGEAQTGNKTKASTGTSSSENVVGQ